MRTSPPRPLRGARSASGEGESARAGPFIKWAGGKNRLLAQFAPYFPPRYRRYFESFVGSAAVFFYLRPAESYLFDRNPELIEVYQIVRDQPDDLIAALRQHYYDKDHYYAVRALKPADLSPVERAARFIFLNKTGYNGLYRVNSRGQFNVPFGRYKNPTICDEEALRAANHALKRAHLSVADFGVILDHAQSGDLVYFDPPYAPLSATSNFTSYTRDGFTDDDQRRLAEVYHVLHRRGCYLMLSNSSAPLIDSLYRRDGYIIHTITARRAINSKADSRGEIQEVLVTNFDSASWGSSNGS